MLRIFFSIIFQGLPQAGLLSPKLQRRQAGQCHLVKRLLFRRNILWVGNTIEFGEAFQRNALCNAGRSAAPERFIPCKITKQIKKIRQQAVKYCLQNAVS